MNPVLRFPEDQSQIQLAFARDEQREGGIHATVSDIIQNVKQNGDVALVEYAKEFDAIELSLEDLKVKPEVCARAWDNLDGSLKAALEYARDGIQDFHEPQRGNGFVINRPGVVLEQRIRPLKRVGCYVPGGRAIYPSTMLMNIIPAQVAGVDEIVIATPPATGGGENYVPYAVAHMLGVSGSVYQIGGAQAVAALAFGTDTIPRVDKVVGPGNQFVALAKRLLYGTIDIDSVAGTSEVLIIADENANADYIAADLLAQAEHTGGESVVLVGIGKFDFEAVFAALDRRVAAAPRGEAMSSSLENGGVFISVATVEYAIEIAELKSPEHMEILTADPEAVADKVRNVGAIFIGPYTPEPIGDYVAGPNHVLPTGGTARFFSPLGVGAFMKASNVLRFEREAFLDAAPHVIKLAESEGLFGHADSIRARMKSEEK